MTSASPRPASGPLPSTHPTTSPPGEGESSARPPTVSATRLVAASVVLILFTGLAVAQGFPAQAHALALATGAAAGAAIAAGAVAVFFLTRPIRALTLSARAMSAGDLSARAPTGGDDELAELGRALNRLAGEHARSLERVRGERDLFGRILDSMGEGVLVLDADERIVLANQALRTMGRLGEDIPGKPLLEGIRSAALKEALDTCREHDEPVVREIELGRPMPRKLLARVSRLAHAEADHEGGHPQTPGGAADGGMIVVFHDVTDLRRLETIRTDFVANVSHELRTPVTAISTAAETLLGGALQDPEEAAEFVGVIDRHSLRLRQLVDDLLDLAKLEAKNFRLVLSDLEVRPILDHAILLMEDSARRRRMTLTVAPGANLRARIDRRALEQVVTNLLDNAIKYAGEGAKVTVGVELAGDRVGITVTDDGIGISPAHLGRVFERFYRVDAGRSRELGGTGLGLSIVKHLVELMGGTVGVESELGKGARFTLRLAAGASPSSPGRAAV
jgi:two-component system, OmpR family, phosphate regulon sensor histidine kinase PhoR